MPPTWTFLMVKTAALYHVPMKSYSRNTHAPSFLKRAVYFLFIRMRRELIHKYLLLLHQIRSRSFRFIQRDLIKSTLGKINRLLDTKLDIELLSFNRSNQRCKSRQRHYLRRKTKPLSKKDKITIFIFFFIFDRKKYSRPNSLLTLDDHCLEGGITTQVTSTISLPQ